jgi:nicotinate-nucleotide--dimethylbenzimidazole phosphoribosyltransferase
MERQAKLTKPPGSLGRLESVAIEMAAFQATESPKARPCSALLFATDHPVTRHGVSPYPQEVTRAMVQNFLSGGAAASVLARQHSIPLHVLDVGVSGESLAPSPAGRANGVLFHRMEAAPPAGDVLNSPALSEVGWKACFDYGSTAVTRLCEEDRLLILGEMGIGNTTTAAAVGAYLLGLEHPGDFVGRGTGAAGQLLQRKKEVVSRAVARVEPGLSGREVLRELGGREMAALYGAMMVALSRRKTVLIDGFIVTAAAAALVRDVPEARAGMVFAHRSEELGHAELLSSLGARPLVGLQMRLGEASGALVAFPLIEAACELHNRMATFQSAGVPDAEVGC